ncbi:hypothetical protein H4R20_006254 [Coemansia guatemalensis]|uniref:Uncharacterized protein n=1 Tax=Coemansia guatemalensis TaxID=2761395 RepID=A0A9W8HPV4_9FUNG|nr:hypothetical protein H4R20_006254 [Coemansia guatemalensis]
MAYNNSKGNSTGDIPKIQLESKEDVVYLQQQFTDFLGQTLSNNSALRDASLQPEQRTEAEQLIHSQLEKWALDIWKVAGHSVAVNGLGFAEAMEEKSKIEPLDEALKSEVEQLREEADSLLLSVTNKRRTVPGQIERLVADSVWRESLAAENTTVIRGLEEPEERDLPFIDGRVNGEFEAAVEMASKLEDLAPDTVKRLVELEELAKDTKARTETASEDDARVRQTLFPASQSSTRHPPASTPDAQLLAYNAALHAITSEPT